MQPHSHALTPAPQVLGQHVALVSKGLRGAGGFGVVHEGVWLEKVGRGLMGCRWVHSQGCEQPS